MYIKQVERIIALKTSPKIKYVHTENLYRKARFIETDYKVDVMIVFFYYPR